MALNGNRNEDYFRGVALSTGRASEDLRDALRRTAARLWRFAA